MNKFTYLVVTGHNTWGRATTIDEARENAECEIDDHHLLYKMSHDDYEVCGITGGVRYPKADKPIIYCEEWKDGKSQMINA